MANAITTTVGAGGGGGSSWTVVTKETAALPQSAQTSYFTVSGLVEVQNIIGVVTTNIQAQVCNTKFIATPTVGNATDMNTVFNVESSLAGEMFYLQGVGSTFGNVATDGAFSIASISYFVKDGTIDLSCSNSNTGNVTWHLIYRAIESGATVTEI